MEELKKYKKAWKLWEEWVKQEDVCNAQNFYIHIDFDGEYLEVAFQKLCEGGREYFKLPFSMMYGILLEFLDKYGFKIFLFPDYTNFRVYQFVIISSKYKLDPQLLFESDITTNKRQEAQLSAVTKAFELLEKRLEG